MIPSFHSSSTPNAQQSGAKLSNLALRTLVAAVGIPLYLFLIYLGGIWFFLANLVIVLAATHEFLLLSRPRADITSWIAMAGAAACLFFMSSGRVGQAASMAVAPFLLILLLHIVIGRCEGTMLYASQAAAAVLYIAWFFGHLFLLRNPTGSLQAWDTPGWQLVLLPLGITWITDTAAYAVGRAVGKHPFAPVVSPKKTWEGAMGGILGGVGAGALAAAVGIVSLKAGIVVGFFVGTVGQLGDLGESLLKREAGVKDSSSLIPGHGGVLDRFDSLLLNIPGTYYLLLLLAPGVH